MYRAPPPCGNHYANTAEFARIVKRLGMRARIKITNIVNEEKLNKKIFGGKAISRIWYLGRNRSQD